MYPDVPLGKSDERIPDSRQSDRNTPGVARWQYDATQDYGYILPDDYGVSEEHQRPIIDNSGRKRVRNGWIPSYNYATRGFTSGTICHIYTDRAVIA